MVIFAVHVGSDCSADGDKFRPGSDRQEPPARNNDLQKVGKKKATLAGKDAVHFIEREYFVEPQRIYDLR